MYDLKLSFSLLLVYRYGWLIISRDLFLPFFDSYKTFILKKSFSTHMLIPEGTMKKKEKQKKSLHRDEIIPNKQSF